jgi:hypothetical protein
MRRVKSMRDWAHPPDRSALGAPENAAAVPGLPDEFCRTPVTCRAAVGDWAGFVAHEDLHHEAKKATCPARGRKPGRSGDEQRRGTPGTLPAPAPS